MADGKLKAWVVAVLLSSFGAAAVAETVWCDSFADRSAWPVCEDYDGSIRITFGCEGPDGGSRMVVSGTSTGKCDTAWCVRTGRILLPRQAPKFRLRFSEGAKGVRKELVTADYRWKTMLVWYGADGKETGRRLFASGVRPGRWEVRLVDELPPSARAFELQLGFDAPDLRQGDEVWFSDIAFEFARDDEPCGFMGADVTPPRVALASESPTADVRTPVAFALSDATGVAWDRTRVVLDGCDRTANFRRVGAIFTLPAPQTPWTHGMHHMVVHAEDVLGNSVDAKKVFYVGVRSGTPAVSLRDDGVALVDGRPFFPIGIYNVKRHAANGFDFNRAFADLGQAGFNFANSYRESRDPGFAAGARRHGFRLFEDAKRISGDLLDKWRHDPVYIAWYIGDDTAEHNTPQMIRDRDDNLRAVDGTRLTCQADWIESPVIKDRYAPFVGLTDVFMPELYPVHGDHDASNCVARVVREMEMARKHNAQDGGGRTCTIWPIIQNFKGWTAWKRYPTADEVTAMSFAALAHGAKGIVWYTYSSTLPPNPAKGRFDAGIADDPDVWNSATNLSRRIAELAPMLLEREEFPVSVEVLRGPSADAFGNRSISCLLKRHAGRYCMLAVNGTVEPVRARFGGFGADAKDAEVLWESRRIVISLCEFEESFGPLEVHVYRWPAQRDSWSTVDGD